MRVIYDLFKTVRKFRDIKEGECFYYPEKDTFLMKTEEVQGITGVIFNAVSLEDGIIYDIYNELEFEVVDSTLIIGKETGLEHKRKGGSEDETNNKESNNE